MSEPPSHTVREQALTLPQGSCLGNGQKRSVPWSLTSQPADQGGTSLSWILNRPFDLPKSVLTKIDSIQQKAQLQVITCTRYIQVYHS